MWWGEWCWWRGGVPYPRTNDQPNPSVTAILGQCMSLSTGTSVSQFVSQSDCHQNVTPWQFHGAGHEPPPVPTYICTGCHTDWVQTLVTTISCRLWQSNGSLTCPFVGGVTAGVHNEGVDISIPLRWMTKMTRMTRNLKSRPWEWLAEVYGNLVIVVILVMEGVWAGH